MVEDCQCPRSSLSLGREMAGDVKLPDVTYFALLVDDGNPKLVMLRDPHEKEPHLPFWKLLSHTGQPHKVRQRTQSHAGARTRRGTLLRGGMPPLEGSEALRLL